SPPTPAQWCGSRRRWAAPSSALPVHSCSGWPRITVCVATRKASPTAATPRPARWCRAPTPARCSPIRTRWRPGSPGWPAPARRHAGSPRPGPPGTSRARGRRTVTQGVHMTDPVLHPSGERAVLVELDTLPEAHALAILAADLPDVLDVVPAARTVLVTTRR